MAVSGVALGSVAVGSILVFAGFKGYSIPATVQDVITGKSPLKQSQVTAITTTDIGSTDTSGGTQGTPVSGNGSVGPRKAYLALRSAGFSQSAAIMMTAIGGVESGWNTLALNNNPATGDLSVGVWQINYFGGLAASRTPLFGSWQDLLHGGLQKQANAAFTLYKQAGGFGPWEPDITSGKILQFWSQAAAAANQ